MIKALRAIIHEGASAMEANKIFEQEKGKEFPGGNQKK
jgi:hypothetical protein